MRFIIGFLIVSVAAAGATKVIWRTDKPDAIAKLNDDLKQAMDGATLNNQQRKALTRSQQALQQAVDAHNNGTSFDTQAVEKAYKTIETMNKADVFGPQKKTIEKDLGKLKEQQQVVRPPRRGGRYDPYGYPTPRGRRW